jgi:methylenetetrahydrofolate reductase (NADPH)
MNQGRYLVDDLLDAHPTDFCIGVGAYPEKHVEAPNLTADVRRLKTKVAAGADYIVSQMFFDNSHYFRFVEFCRREGIVVPIIPGLKVLSSRSQLKSIPRNFYVEIPPPLADAAGSVAEKEVLDVGVDWTLRQAVELLERGVPGLHFFVVHDAEPIRRLLAKLRP